MRDDGQEADATAGDGIFTAIIPGTVTTDGFTTNTFATGRLIRWYFHAPDTAGHIFEWPLYPDLQNSARRLGTVSQDAADAFSPVHPADCRFGIGLPKTPPTSPAAPARGARCFSGTGFTITFSSGCAGRVRRGLPKSSTSTPAITVSSTQPQAPWRGANLNDSSDDPTLVRPTLAFEVFRRAGAPACNAFPVLLRGAYSTNLPTAANSHNAIAYFIEQVDERFLGAQRLRPAGCGLQTCLALRHQTTLH